MVDNEKNIYHLGKISWFGGYDRKKECYNKFGFLNGRIYFNKSVFDSINIDNHIRNQLLNNTVLYILRSEDDSSKEASWVRLLSEMNEEELRDLYSQNSSLKEIFTDFSNTLELLDIEAVQGLLKHIVQEEGINGILEYLQTGPLDLVIGGLWAQLNDLLPWKTMKEIFAGLSNTSKTLKFLNKEDVQGILKHILQEEGKKGLLEFLLNKPYLTEYYIEQSIDLLPWMTMDNEERIAFFLCCPNYNRRTTFILRDTFPYWVNNDEVIRRLDTRHFPECIRKGIESQDIVSLSLLFDCVSNQSVKRELASLLPFEYFNSNQDFCLAMSDEAKASVLETRLRNENSNLLESFSTLLTTIDPFSSPKSTVVLSNKLYALNLTLNVWERMEESEKVWFILFLSFKLNQREKWIDSFRKIYIYEKNNHPCSSAVLAALDFLSIAFVDNNKKQTSFDKAHESLERAIVYDYNNNGVCSDALKQLVCKCSCDYIDICSVKYWERWDTGWCSSKHCVCNSFKNNNKKFDFWNTAYSQKRQLKAEDAIRYLSLADLLHNVGFTPSLDKVYSPVLGHKWRIDEYVYKISGRIIQLDRLFTHMHCRCKKMMKSDYAYAIKPNARFSITHAYCPDASNIDIEGHDEDVYLNECWNCDTIIDSRECKFKQDDNGMIHSAQNKDIFGYYICMKCGAGKIGINPHICPNCGSESIETRSKGNRVEFVSCNICNYTIE